MRTVFFCSSSFIYLLNLFFSLNLIPHLLFSSSSSSFFLFLCPLFLLRISLNIFSFFFSLHLLLLRFRKKFMYLVEERYRSLMWGVSFGNLYNPWLWVSPALSTEMKAKLPPWNIQHEWRHTKGVVSQYKKKNDMDAYKWTWHIFQSQYNCDNNNFYHRYPCIYIGACICTCANSDCGKSLLKPFSKILSNLEISLRSRFTSNHIWI